jgi:hypothetical protein
LALRLLAGNGLLVALATCFLGDVSLAEPDTELRARLRDMLVDIVTRFG